MNLTINNLAALAKSLNASPSELKALIKLASIEVLSSLGEGKYSIAMQNKNLTVSSQLPLESQAKYWATLANPKSALPELSSLVKMPSLLAQQNTHIRYEFDFLRELFSKPKPVERLKSSLLEQLAMSTSKEEFKELSTLLLSLQHGVVTLPMLFKGFYGVLQFKKRYNTKNKREHIEFYAALELLGPVSGLISLEDELIELTLNVAYAQTKEFLELHTREFSHALTIALMPSIEPLAELNENRSLLDIVI